VRGLFGTSIQVWGRKEGEANREMGLGKKTDAEWPRLGCRVR